MTATPEELDAWRAQVDGVIEILHSLGAPNRRDHPRIVGKTEAERRCAEPEDDEGRAVHKRRLPNGGHHTWPDWCQRHTHDTENCLGYWAREWSDRADLAFGGCEHVHVLIAKPEWMNRIHDRIRKHSTLPVMRLTLRLGGVVVIFTDAPIEPGGKGVLAQLDIPALPWEGGTCNPASSIVYGVLRTFHLDGRDNPDSGRGNASRPVLSSNIPNLPKAPKAGAPLWFETARLGELYEAEWERILEEIRAERPDLPAEFHLWERDHPDVVKDMEAEALEEARERFNAEKGSRGVR